MSEELQIRGLLLSKQRGHYNRFHKVLYKENQAQQFEKQGSSH